AGVEALVEAVLPRRARLDEQGPYSTGRQEAPGGVGDELRSVIATDEPRRPVDGHEALQLPHHARRREAAARLGEAGQLTEPAHHLVLEVHGGVVAAGDARVH